MQYQLLVNVKNLIYIQVPKFTAPTCKLNKVINQHSL